MVSMDARGDSNGKQHGAELRARAQGRRVSDLTAALAALDPDLPGMADGFIFGDVWGRPGLDFEDRMLVAITALAVQGQITQLRNYLHGALQAGMAEERIHEALLMTCVYAGFPTALNALECWRVARDSEAKR
jgi:4-carboxymuconolactone decarboxylase